MARRPTDSSQGSCRAAVALLVVQVVLMLLLVSGPKKAAEAPKHDNRAMLIWVFPWRNPSGSAGQGIEHPRWWQKLLGSQPGWTRWHTMHRQKLQFGQGLQQQYNVRPGHVFNRPSVKVTPGSIMSSSSSSSRQVLQSAQQPHPPKVTLQELLSNASIRQNNGSLQVKLPAVTVPSSANGPRDTQLPAVAVDVKLSDLFPNEGRGRRSLQQFADNARTRSSRDSNQGLSSYLERNPESAEGIAQLSGTSTPRLQSDPGQVKLCQLFSTSCTSPGRRKLNYAESPAQSQQQTPLPVTVTLAKATTAPRSLLQVGSSPAGLDAWLRTADPSDRSYVQQIVGEKSSRSATITDVVGSDSIVTSSSSGSGDSNRSVVTPKRLARRMLSSGSSSVAPGLVSAVSSSWLQLSLHHTLRAWLTPTMTRLAAVVSTALQQSEMQQ